jgi:hypothetical protein
MVLGRMQTPLKTFVVRKDVHTKKGDHKQYCIPGGNALPQRLLDGWVLCATAAHGKSVPARFTCHL